MRHRRRIVLQAVMLVASVSLSGACGGASTVNLGGDAGSASGGSGSSSGSTSGGSSGSGSGSSSGGSSGSSSGGSSGSSSGSSSGGGSGGGSGGSSGSSSGGGSGSGSSSGGGSGSSSGGTTFGCPTAPCSPGEVCCTQAGAASIACSPACMSTDTLECLHPGDCSNGRDCCETVAVQGGQAPNCMVQSLSSRCEANCKTSFTTTCQGTDTLHVCAQASDCSNDANSPNCCDVRGQLVCVSDALAMAGLSCQ
jgi:hypothetical protein